MLWYAEGLAAFVNGDVDWVTDTIRVALVASAYTPNQGEDANWGEISEHEVSGTGYTAGGAEIGTRTVNVDSGTLRAQLRGDDVTWSESTITAHYAVVYMDTGVASTSLLLGYSDFDEDKSSENGNFTLDADQVQGWLRITASAT